MPKEAQPFSRRAQPITATAINGDEVVAEGKHSRIKPALVRVKAEVRRPVAWRSLKR